MTETKNCKICCSEIHAEAIVCPICKKNNELFLVSLKNPNLRFLIGFLFTLCLIALFNYGVYNTNLFKRRMISTPENKNLKVKILSHKLILENGPRIIGKIKNIGKGKIDSLSLVSYFDNSNKQLMKISSTYISGKLMPGDEKFFQIEIFCSKDVPKNIDDFKNYELKVENIQSYSF